MKIKVVVVAVTLAFTPLALSQRSGPYVFSYTGQLLNGDKPVSGPVDVEVRFFRQPSGGDALKISPIVKSGVPVTADGVFQVDIDLLADEEMHVVFDATSATWVEITAAGRTYPRQRLTSVPYAMKVPVQGRTVRYDEKGRLTVGPDAAPGSNEFLTRNGDGEWVWAAPSAGATALAGSPLDPTPPAAGQVLQYDGAAARWKPAPLLPVGGSNGQFLRTDGAGVLSWATPTGAGDMQKSVYDASPFDNIIDTARLPGASTTASGIVELATAGETASGLAVQANDARLSDARTPTGSASGVLSGTYPAPGLANGVVTTSSIADFTITANDIQNGAITSTNILDGTIGAIDLAPSVRSSLDAADGAPSNAVAVDADGKVGLGITTPTTNAHIHGVGTVGLGMTTTGTGSTATDGALLFMNGSNELLLVNQESSKLVLSTSNTPRLGITSTGAVGIGTTSPSMLLDVTSTTGSNYMGMSLYEGALGGAIVAGRKARGTDVAPTNVQSGDYIAHFQGQGYGGGFGLGAAMNVVATETWSASARGAAITFVTNPNGSISNQERMRIAQDGKVGIGITPTAPLHVNTTSAGNVFQLAYNAADFFKVDNFGRIGIGTSPSAFLTMSVPSWSGPAPVNGLYLSVPSSAASFTENGTAASGTLPTVAFSHFRAPTLASFNTSVTTTNAYTALIGGAPMKGTNNTVTNAIALGIAPGAVGAQTKAYSLFVEAPTGAGSNYAAAFLGGNVGIGTATPARKLHISDAMRLEPIAAPPASPSNGDIYYDSSHALCVFVNGVWEAIAGAGSCS